MKSSSFYGNSKKNRLSAWFLALLTSKLTSRTFFVYPVFFLRFIYKYRIEEVSFGFRHILFKPSVFLLSYRFVIKLNCIHVLVGDWYQLSRSTICYVIRAEILYLSSFDRDVHCIRRSFLRSFVNSLQFIKPLTWICRR